MTLDEARDAFEANPSPATANTYREEARLYAADGIIAAATLGAILDETAPLATEGF